MMIAKVTKLNLGEFIHTFGDAHLYLNHLDQVDEQLKRKPYALPQMKLNTDIDDIFKFRYEHFELNNYQAHSKISAPIAI
jgi:thymidylate synthase